MRKIITVLLCSFMISILGSCGKPANQFVGKWEEYKVTQLMITSMPSIYDIQYSEYDMTNLISTDGKIYIKNNGKIYIYMQHVKYIGTWKMDEDSKDILNCSINTIKADTKFYTKKDKDVLDIIDSDNICNIHMNEDDGTIYLYSSSDYKHYFQQML